MTSSRSIYFFLIWLFVNMFFGNYGQTNLPAGNISGTLSLAGSPYLVQGHVTVAQSTTLMIEPGVVLEFQGHYKFIVNGCLLAVGNALDTIRFRSSTGSSSSGWWGIRFNYTFLYQDSSRLAFCKIQMGNASGTAYDAFGGALSFMNTLQVNVSNCLISGNYATQGGAMYFYKSDPLIYKNTIINNGVLTNTYSCYGGAIRIESNAGPTIINNIISNNSSTFHGGGFYTTSPNAKVYDNLISDNFASVAGGGLYCGVWGTIQENTIRANSSLQGGGICIGGSSTYTIAGNLIESNKATEGGGIYSLGANIHINTNTIVSNFASTGGGMTIYGAGGADTHTITSNFICNNTATVGGGGAHIMFVNAPFANNVCVNNTTAGRGGGVLLKGCSPLIANCTIANNKANDGGGIFCETAAPKIRNNILFGNIAVSGNGQQLYLFDAPSNPSILYNMVQGGLPAIFANGFTYLGTFQNNNSSNPLFIGPSPGTGTAFSGMSANWNIAMSSPCINTGTLQLYGFNLPKIDIGGITRVIGPAVDQGAYEFNSCPFTTVNTEVTKTGNTYNATAIGSYQWLNCDNNMSPIPNATTKFFTPKGDGNYAVIITELGCTDTSDCFNVYTVSIDELKSSEQASIFPSPCTSSLNINFGSQLNRIHIIVLSTDAKIVFEKPYIEQTQFSLDLTNLAKGLYVLRIEMGDETIVRKIVKD